MVLVAGWLGVLFPQVTFSTPVEALLPASARHNVYVYAHVHDQLSQVQRFTGYAHGRPSALFAYTNGWGATFAITYGGSKLGSHRWALTVKPTTVPRPETGAASHDRLWHVGQIGTGGCTNA